MGDFPLPEFYYPVCIPTTFNSINVNVLCIPPGNAEAGERLHKEYTVQLRDLLDKSEYRRERMRQCVTRHKYNNIYHRDVPIGDQVLVADPLTQAISRMLAVDFACYAIESPEIDDDGDDSTVYSATRILAQHIKVAAYSSEYAESLQDAIAWIEANEEVATIWRVCPTGTADLKRNSASDRHVGILGNDWGSTDYHHKTSPVYMPAFTWIGSGTLVHKHSQARMICGALYYDLCMALVVSAMAHINIAMQTIRIHQSSVEPIGAIRTSIIAPLCSAVELLEQCLCVRDKWTTKPVSSKMHAELQPTVLCSLVEFCNAMRLFYTHELYEYLPEPTAPIVMSNLAEYEPSGIKDNKRFIAMLQFSSKMAEAYTYYGKLKACRPDFLNYLHVCTIVAFARVTYLFASLKFGHYLMSSASLNRRVDRKDVLSKTTDYSTKQVLMLMRILESECKFINGWNANVQDILRMSTETLDQTSESRVRAAPVTSRHVDVSLTCVNLYSLHNLCKSTWELLNSVKIAVGVEQRKVVM